MADNDTNPFADAAAQVMHTDAQNTAVQIRNNVQFAVGQNPDQAAQYQHLAKYVGVPVETVHAQPEAIKQQAALQSMDADKMVSDYPTLSKYLTDQNNAAKSHDDIAPLASVEAATKALPAPSPAAAAPSFGDTLAGLPLDVMKGLGGAFNKASSSLNLALGAFPTVYDKVASLYTGKRTTAAEDAWFKRMVDPGVTNQQTFDTKPNDPFISKAANTAGNLLGLLSQISLTGGAAEAAPVATTVPQVVAQAATHGTKSMAFPAISDSVDTARKVYLETGDAKQALRAAQMQYANTTAMGIVPLSAPGGLAARTAGGFASGVASGEASRQAMNLVLPTSMQQPFDTESMILSGLSGSMLAGVMGPRSEPTYHADIRQTYADAAKAEAATQGMQSLKALSASSAAAKTRTRDPQAFNDYVKNATEDGQLKDVYVEANKLAEVLNQSGVNIEKLAETLPDLAAQIHEAVQTNGDVRIPVADYATHIAGGPIDEALLPHLKTDPDGMTFHEGQEYYQNQQTEMKAMAEKIVADKGNDDARQAEIKDVHDKVLDQLTSAGRFGPEVNKAYAALTRDFYVTQAERAGMTPREMHERYPLRVTGEAGKGGFNQGTPRDAYKWQAVGQTANGPIYKGNGFVLDPVGKIAHEPHDDGEFQPNGMVEHELMGHQDHIPEGSTPYIFAINKNGLKVGHLVADVKDGQIVAIHGIDAYTKNEGLGANVLAHIAANHGEPVKVIEAIDQSRGFWDKVGGNVLDQYKNTSYDWQSIKRYLDGKSQGDQAKGDGAQDIAGSTGTHGLEAHELTEAEIKELEAQGFKFNQHNRGTFSPDANTIGLLKNADLSTYLHESGHFFLEVMHDLSSRADAPEALKSDFDVLLKSFGVEGATPEERLADWSNRSLEQKRAGHEQFAESFEKYLMEGKAPSLELQPLFSRFRSWLLNVYKSLSGIGVELTPEVRGVMDRMLASEETIKQAEQTRGYSSMLAAPEGQSPEEFAAYQALGKEATDQAITDMTARSIRDMRWASNAKNKAIKGLQKEANAQRIAIRGEVTHEVMRQPVYQAWQFLSMKGHESTQVLPEAKEANDPKRVNPAKDSLFTAIAKHGGLNPDEVKTKWGVDHNDMPDSGVFGKPVVRKSGGLSIDRMAERLAEDHYLSDHDLHEFEDKFDRERGGDTQYSWHHEYRDGERPAEAIDRTVNYHGKLSTSELRHMYGEGQDATWRKLSDRRMTSDKLGLDPDIVAETFGFGSGRQLVDALATAESPYRAIEGMVDQRMLERHGELTDPVSIERAAEAAIHNDVRAKFMATGLKMLSKSPVPASQLTKAATEAAHAAVAAKKINDLRPAQYSAAEARATRDAVKLAPKDPNGAVQAQRAALLNNRLFKAASDAVTDVQKGVQYLKKFDKDSIRGKIAVDIRDQIDDLLSRFDLRQKVPDGLTRKQLNLQQWIESQNAAGYSPTVTADMLDPGFRTHFKDMTVEQFRGLVDSIKAMEYIGKKRQELTIGGEKVELNDYVATKLVPKLQERGDKFSKADLIDRPEDRTNGHFSLALDRLNAWRRGAAAQLKPTEFKRNQYDMHELLGPMGESIFEPVINANYHKVDMLKGLSDDFQKLANEQGKKWQDSLRSLVDNHELLDPDKSTPGNPVMMHLTRAKMIGIAIHVGNESNFNKLTAGWGWKPEAVWRFLHDNMTEKDWKATQGIWDLYEKHWPEMEAMNRRLGNTSPEKIEPRAFKTKFGEQPGGYAAIAYDPLRSRRGEREAQVQAIDPSDGLFGRGYFKPDTTTNGSMNNRAEGYTDRVELDFHHIATRLHETVHDLAYREAAIDANKIIEHPDFRSAFRTAYGPEAYKSLQEWLGKVVNSENGDKHVGALGRFLQYTRTGMVMTAIALRASTVLKHGGSAGIKTTGYFVGGGEKYLASRMASMVSDYSNQIASAKDKFGEIRARLLQQDRDFRVTSTALFEKDSAHAKAERFGHAAVAWSDMMTAVPTAWAAYDRAITEGIPVKQGGTGKPMTEAQAVNYANKIVREAHGSNIETARSMALNTSSEALKMFTTLYGFMNTSYGQALDGFDKLGTKGIGNEAVLARSFMALIVPALWAHYLTHGSTKENEGWAAWIAKAVAGEVAGMVPFVRDTASMVEGYANAGVVGAESWLSTIVHAVKDVVHMSEGKPVKAPIKDISNAVGMGLHIPGLGQLGGTVQYATDVSQGKEHPADSFEYGKGLLFGHGEKH